MYWYKNMPSYQTFDDIKHRKSASSIIRRTFVEFVILAFLLGVAFFMFSGINYIDIRDACFIRVKYDVLQGDRESIFDALKRIKKEDYIFYRNMCRYVDRIYEKRCVVSEKNTPKVSYPNEDGCYIRGSKAILIKPLDKNSYDLVDNRVAAIKKYGQMAIDYWRQNPD